MNLREQIIERLDKRKKHYCEDENLFVKIRKALDNLKFASLKIEPRYHSIDIYVADRALYRFHKTIEVYFNHDGVFVAVRRNQEDWEHTRVAMLDPTISLLARTIADALAKNERFTP